MENKKRNRDVPVLFWISKDEEEQINAKMQAAGTKNKSAYLRKMALGGFIVTQDYGAIRNATKELNRIGVNLNQIAKVVNSYGGSYLPELQTIEKDMEQIWQQLLSKG